jgi:hypothetical protein
MPHKDPEEKRAYHRRYMQKRRTVAKELSNPAKGDSLTTESTTVAKYDPRRAHRHTMVKINGRWRRAVEQDGLTYDRDSGELIRGVH